MDREKIIKKAERIMRSTVDRDMIDSFCEDVIALLEEQEAVKIKVKKINNSGRCGRCPNCLIELNETDYPNWCGYCGQKVKWE